MVKTLLGRPRKRLFQFAGIHGIGDRVRLQRLLGAAHRDGARYLAGTIAHRIQIIDLMTRVVAKLPFKGASPSKPKSAHGSAQ